MMFEQHDDYKPVTWVRGNPIYVTHLIVLFFSVTMLVATVLGPNVTQAMIRSMGFLSREVHGGEVWRIFTYGLVNPPSINFVIDMIIIAWFGREMERFFGRKVFLGFYAALYLLVPVVLTLLGFLRPTALAGEIGGFAIFIAFATLYPGAVLIFNITAKWLAIIGVGIYSLLFLYGRDLVELASLWTTTGFAYSFVRYHQGRIQLPRFSWPGSKPKLRVLQRTRDVETLGAGEDDDDELENDVDDLLEKIARNGLASLSKSERERLELARENLLKKDRK
jgi:membrane associated rhomboid family serine protease